MSGYWCVEVRENGKVYSASRAYGSDEARFEMRGDAEDLVDEIMWWYENTHPKDSAQCRLLFRNENGVVQETEWV